MQSDINDPAVSDNQVARQAIALASSAWSLDLELMPSTTDASQTLSEHRIATVFPLRCIVAEDRPDFVNRISHIYGVQMRIEENANRVLEVFDGADIPARVLKGLATAELDYPDRRLRQTGDVDLLVPQHELERATALLLARDFRPHPGESSAPLRKGITLTSPTKVEIDLHTRLFQRSRDGDVDLFAHPVALNDLNGSALPAELRLVHAAAHFVLAPQGTRRVSGLIDITMLLNRDDVDLDLARRQASQLRVGGLVGAALRYEAQLTGRPQTRFATWPKVDWLDRKTRLEPERNLILDHLARYREVPRSQRLRYLPEWIVPDRRRRRLFIRSITKRLRHRS